MMPRRWGQVGTLAMLMMTVGPACGNPKSGDPRTTQMAHKPLTTNLTNPTGIVWNGVAGQTGAHVRVRVHFRPMIYAGYPREIENAEFTTSTGVMTAAQVAFELETQWNGQPNYMRSTASTPSNGINKFEWTVAQQERVIDRIEVDSFTDNCDCPVELTTMQTVIVQGLYAKLSYQ